MAKSTNSEILTPAEVARYFKVDAKTVTRWAKAGKLPCIYTLGGHRRYYRKDVEEALAKVQGENNGGV